MANGLHPRVLTEQGLREALAELARDVPAQVNLEVTEAELPPWVAAAVYFICAEALSNAAKHAAASRVGVAVRVGDGWLKVEIADDGRGGADASHGSGLRGLADRVEALGGSFRVESRSGLGTRLAAEIPLDGPLELAGAEPLIARAQEALHRHCAECPNRLGLTLRPQGGESDFVPVGRTQQGAA